MFKYRRSSPNVDAAALAISAVAATATLALIYFARDAAVAAKDALHQARAARHLRCRDDLGGELDLSRPGDAARLEERGRVDRLADQRFDDRGERLVTPHHDHDA